MVSAQATARPRIARADRLRVNTGIVSSLLFFVLACSCFSQAPLDQVWQAAAALASAGFIPLHETALLTAAVCD
jgi:hypothetical protein